MFLKVSKVKGYEYVRIVYSYRTEDNKVRHKTVANLGRADKLHLMFPAFEKQFELYAQNVFSIDKINTQEACIKNNATLERSKQWLPPPVF